MRNLFLVVLLANVLFFAWQYWVTPPEVNPFALRGEHAVKDVALYVAPRPASARAPAAAAAGGTPVTGKALHGEGCYRIGPFAERGSAESVRTTVARGGWEADLLTDEGQIWLGHWVQIEKVGDRAATEQAVARLKAAGIADAYLVESPPPYSVSLGVFRERDRADKAAAVARGLGLAPTIGDRVRSGTQHWVSVRLAAAQTLDIGRLGLDPGQIARAEGIPCVAPAAPKP